MAETDTHARRRKGQLQCMCVHIIRILGSLV